MGKLFEIDNTPLSELRLNASGWVMLE